MMRILECEQQSPEWDAVRLGIPTSSHFSELLTTKGEPSKQALAYCHTLAAERLSGQGEPSYSSKAMREGTRREAESRMVYAMLKEVEVRQVGFCLSDCGRYGCSPDGLVGDDGGVELKNPTGKVAIEYLLAGKLPTAYIQQVQGSLLVTEREWWDFVSYYPGLPPLIVRVLRDEPYIKKLENALEAFGVMLDKTCEQVAGDPSSAVPITTPKEKESSLDDAGF